MKVLKCAFISMYEGDYYIYTYSLVRLPSCQLPKNHVGLHLLFNSCI
jgi:hypothetical protein